MALNSPFRSSVATPGNGKVILSSLSPAIPTLTTLTYKYPLKLLSRVPAFTPESTVLPDTIKPIHLYILTYGGGLLSGDHIDVSITLCPRTRLVVTTPQGSTKIFKTASGEQRLPARAGKDDTSRQILNVDIGRQAAFCYLPDPSAPFRDSRYEQVQTFTVDGDQTGNHRSSLCVLDWVTQGRASRGENWDFYSWRGRNEVWSSDGSRNRRLLLRDSIILDDEKRTPKNRKDISPNSSSGTIGERMFPHGIVGTLILYGPIFDSLGSFFMDRFGSQPRIGGRDWSSQSAPPDPGSKLKEAVTWTAARVRAGFVLVKFGARNFEAARHWLGGIIREEGSVAREFGEDALFCL